MKNFIIAILILCLFFAGFIVGLKVPKPSLIAQTDTTITDIHIPKYNVCGFIRQIGIEHPDVVYAQAVLGSGYFKSKLYLNHNNIFAMKEAKKRPTLQVGTTDSGYGVYARWEDAVIDYYLWQLKYAQSLTKAEYLDTIGRIYAEDRQYIQKIKTILK